MARSLEVPKTLEMTALITDGFLYLALTPSAETRLRRTGAHSLVYAKVWKTGMLDAVRAGSRLAESGEFRERWSRG